MRRTLVALVAVAALAAPAATAADSSPLADAFAKTAQAESYRSAFVGEVTVAGQVRPLRFTATSETDNRTKRLSMRMDLSRLAALAGGIGKPADWRVRAVLDARTLVMYMRFPFLNLVTGAKKPWLRVDLTKTSSVSGLDLSLFSQADPAQQLRLLRATTGEVEEVGREEVRGTDTTHYRTTIDYAKVVALAPAKQRPALRRTVRQLEQTKVPLDVWVGDDDLVRRMEITIALRNQGETTVSLDIFDYGAGIDVQLPPASQVADLKTTKGN
jgi:hypothetical protein